MIFDEERLTRLLGSVEANRLVVLCGAGLSIPSPSNLMTAERVANVCYDKYRPIHELPATMRGQVDQIAGHFYDSQEFESVFLGSLVPWGELTGEPNKGHAAISDLLITRGLAAALSANFDMLIEQWAWSRKMDLHGALDGVEAMALSTEMSPLLKFHGCMTKGRKKTLWTQAQLTEPGIAQTVERCGDWMKLFLPQKDLLIIGFWTDWGYLNRVLAEALNAIPFGSVTVVDPDTSVNLQNKAPELWATLSPGPHFRHFERSGADALEELRVEYSKVWLKRFLRLAEPLLTEIGKACPERNLALDCEDLYNARRDGEGVPYNRAARTKAPAASAAKAALAHHLLLDAGAMRDGAWYLKDGRRIRVVNGVGQAMNSVRGQYKEPPAAAQPDIVICAGAEDLSVPGNLISPGEDKSIVRPSGGGTATWMTFEQARGELQI
jgi:hypothetical protein